jgi:3-methyl-2-oxobutanoate hydroxymethyltransferase
MAGYISEAAQTYAGEVRDRSFPTADQIYAPKS